MVGPPYTVWPHRELIAEIPTAFAGLEVDHKFEPGRLETGKSAGLSPLRMRPA
jgi:hypothetical protein